MCVCVWCVYVTTIERIRKMRLDTNGATYTLWNKDVPDLPDTNLYGSHPFVMKVVEPGRAHGIFVLNSNAMDVVINPDSLTYKVHHEQWLCVWGIAFILLS